MKTKYQKIYDVLKSHFGDGEDTENAAQDIAIMLSKDNDKEQ